jgi:predicted HTH domain antitoxin
LKLKEANDNLYESEEKAVSDALELLLKENPEYRMKLALYRYQHEEISIGKAAQIAGVCWEDMKENLVENGINPRFAPRTIEEARKDYYVARKLMDERDRK